jgi:hypothetical protein
MSQNVAFWAIFASNGKRHLTIPYCQRQIAEDTLSILNKDRTKELYYCVMVKDKIVDLPKQVYKVDYYDREAKIPFVTPEGEKRLARKHFRDIQILSLAEGKIPVTDTLTVHTFKGKLRVKFDGISYHFDKFEEVAQLRWPNAWEDVLMYCQL